VNRNLYLSLAISVIATLGFACNQTDATNANNTNMENATATSTGPDDSEITTTTDANGVKTETRVFRNNPRISKVVVTTRNGQRTVKAYSASGEEKEINDVGDALSATGDAIAQSAGFVADKAEDVAGETKEGAEEVGEKTVDAAEKVGDKTVEGAKKVGNKTAGAAKKVGKKVKDAVTP
jgi:hypothetical protein